MPPLPFRLPTGGPVAGTAFHQPTADSLLANMSNRRSFRSVMKLFLF
jgi:hypothetical protein